MDTSSDNQVRYVVFKEHGTWYAAGLELNIVESGKTAHQALLELFDALQGYHEGMCRLASDALSLTTSHCSGYQELRHQVATATPHR